METAAGMRKEAWGRTEVPTGILKHKTDESRYSTAPIYAVSNLDESTLKKYEDSLKNGAATVQKGGKKDEATFKKRPRRKTSADIAFAKAPAVCCFGCSLQ
jgi:hypothetical protein